MERAESPLIVIVGPTASGKTAVAIELAEQLGGEIICADSRTIYRGMDIGTAKPSAAERARIPHWGLDLANPDETFTVADFKAYTDKKIADIRSRGKVPFLVGGSGLYVDAVVFDYQFGGEVDIEQRARLEKMNLSELHEYCKNNNISLPENSGNKRYVIRTIERNGINLQRRLIPASKTIIVGIATEKNILRSRIVARSEQILSQGVVEEAIILGEKYGWKQEAMTGNIYPLIYSYLEKKSNKQEMKDKFTTLDWQLAKRQLTWFRRNPYVIWLSYDDVTLYIKATLAPN